MWRHWTWWESSHCMNIFRRCCYEICGSWSLLNTKLPCQALEQVTISVPCLESLSFGHRNMDALLYSFLPLVHGHWRKGIKDKLQTIWRTNTSSSWVDSQSLLSECAFLSCPGAAPTSCQENSVKPDLDWVSLHIFMRLRATLTLRTSNFVSSKGNIWLRQHIYTYQAGSQRYD